MRAATVEEGLTPTMVERVQPQLWLVSTAHRLATELMLDRRRVALAGLEQGDGDLLVEWSTPQDAEARRRGRLAAGVAALDVEAGAADLEAAGGGPAGRGRPCRRGARPGAVVPVAVAEPVAATARRSRPGTTEPLLPDGLWVQLEESDLGDRAR